jgi:hypothetical protein
VQIFLFQSSYWQLILMTCSCCWIGLRGSELQTLKQTLKEQLKIALKKNLKKYVQSDVKAGCCCFC